MYATLWVRVKFTGLCRGLWSLLQLLRCVSKFRSGLVVVVQDSCRYHVDIFEESVQYLSQVSEVEGFRNFSSKIYLATLL